MKDTNHEKVACCFTYLPTSSFPKNRKSARLQLCHKGAKYSRASFYAIIVSRKNVA